MRPTCTCPPGSGAAHVEGCPAVPIAAFRSDLSVPREAFDTACALVRRAVAERDPGLKKLILADLEALEREHA